MGGASVAQSQFVLELKDVDKDYPRIPDRLRLPGQKEERERLHALARVSLRIQSGEFVFLTGPSGAGKTTLIRLALGLENPSAGEIYSLGQPISKMSEGKRRALRRQMGVIFQDHRLITALNVYENVELPLTFGGLSKKERERRVLEILEVVQLRDLLTSPVPSLSAGEKQRVGIARALATCPNFILADEPTGNLDPVSARSLIRMLRELKGHGTTVLIATHDMSLVRDFGGRVLELVGGAMATSAPNKFSKAYKVPKFWAAPQT